ncbi:uncharacterized protein LOC134744578 [Cydia strobilella]|uniref:uncharacterized protein LOC134744578 n=1 Tax=Cydia strobilella TaxID=1100964 RepID=UPI003007160F
MPPITSGCAGCKLPFPKRNEYLACSLCKLKYDLTCASVDSTTFSSMNTQQKSKWICPECCCKQPKTGNTNTPVRQAAAGLAVVPAAGNPDSSNVDANPKQKKQTMEPASSPTPARWEGKEEMSSALKATIQRLVADKLQSINEELASFRNSMNFYDEKYESMKKTAEEQRVTIAELTNENQQLRTSVSDLQARVNIVEVHMRECNIEINGVPENRAENLINTVVVQLSTVIKSPVTTDDIQTVTRVAKLSEDNDRPRAIIAKFRTPRLRDTILAAVSKFNKDNVKDRLSSQHLGIGGHRFPVFVAEHLTPAAKKLHAATRMKARELSYKYVWVRNGRIYARKDD